MRNDEAVSACVAAVQRGAPVDGLLALPHDAKVALLRGWLARIRDPYAIVRSLSVNEVRLLRQTIDFALQDEQRGAWKGAEPFRLPPCGRPDPDPRMAPCSADHGHDGPHLYSGEIVRPGATADDWDEALDAWTRRQT